MPAMNAAAASVLFALTALPFPAPRVVEVTDQTKCDWGAVVSVNADASRLVVATAAGPVTFQIGPNVQVIGLDGKSIGTVAALKTGTKVRVYYVVDNGAKPSEIDVVE